MIIITTVTATENIATEQINIACDQKFYYKLHKCIKYIKEIQELKEMMNEAEREREPGWKRALAEPRQEVKKITSQI